VSLRKRHRLVVIAFDPGETTGVAVITATNQILETAALDERLVTSKAKALKRHYKGAPVAIEAGPLWRSDSPLTKNVEYELLDIFPFATLVSPNQWKGHPAALCSEKVNTRHERDAVRLGRWFLAKGVLDKNGKDETETGPVTA